MYIPINYFYSYFPVYFFFYVDFSCFGNIVLGADLNYELIGCPNVEYIELIFADLCKSPYEYERFVIVFYCYVIIVLFTFVIILDKIIYV
jgi:hypothetical protein